MVGGVHPRKGRLADGLLCLPSASSAHSSGVRMSVPGGKHRHSRKQNISSNLCTACDLASLQLLEAPVFGDKLDLPPDSQTPIASRSPPLPLCDVFLNQVPIFSVVTPQVHTGAMSSQEILPRLSLPQMQVVQMRGPSHNFIVSHETCVVDCALCISNNKITLT